MGDTISPKLLNWENEGVKMDEEFLNNLRYADDIFIRSETPQELQQMLQELCDESRRMGLKGALYRIWCGVNRLGDSGVNRLGGISAFVIPAGQLLLTGGVRPKCIPSA